jgi:PAX-interacting protein 1
MYALCRAKYILHSSWLEESAKAGNFLPEDNFWINDLSQANFKCDVQFVVKSAMRSRLFENRVFYITPSVTPSPNYLRYLIESCGGRCEQNRRSLAKIHEINQQSQNYFVISCPEDLHLLGFKHFVCYVVTSEFILQSIMTQTVDFLKSELQLSR